jgi:hypothetical protein
MDSVTDIYEFPLTLKVRKSAFVMVAPPPATVTQRTVEQHFGVTPRMFKQMVRDGMLPAKRIGHMIFVAYDDVRRVVTEGAEARQRVTHDLTRAVEGEEDAPMSIEAAKEYLASARTMSEFRERRKEIERESHELTRKWSPTLDDESPNPAYDERLYDHGIRLLLVTAVVRFAAQKAASTATLGNGYNSTCCWCDRPAYATKQTWMGSYWNGGPVCKAHANGRAPNERVVDIGTRTILLPAKDPKVPVEYDLPHRRRRR